METQQFKYYAFISYSSKDTEWGKRLQRKLEHYRMPSTLCREHGWERKPIRPVFFAPTDIQPKGLTEELQERLRASRNLIVICSPNSAQSEWVGKEIEFFHSLGRTKQIHFFIVDGVPHSGDPSTECFNPVTEKLGMPEILGANVHERNYRWPWLNRERAYVQLVSVLLGVEFDEIWQRHKRLLKKRIAVWTAVTAAVLAAFVGVWLGNKAVDVQLSVQEASVRNDSLPPLEQAEVTFTLDNETKTGTLSSLSDSLVFANIPHRFLGREVGISITCKDCLPVDTTVVLTKRLTIAVRRDPAVYGHLRYQLWNTDTEQTAPFTEIDIDGHIVRSDADGYVTLEIPLAEQRQRYAVSSKAVSIVDPTVVMPCGESEVIVYK